MSAPKDKPKPAQKRAKAFDIVGPDGPRQYTRRQVITRVASTAGIAAASVGVGAWLLGREPALVGTQLEEIRDHAVERPAGSVELAIARGPDAVANTRKVIEAMGGMGAFVRPGERVVVKPNVGWNRRPVQAANTNPDVVAEVVRHVVAAGAAVVWVTDNPVNNAERCFARSGIAEAAQAAGAELVLPQSNSYRTVAVGGHVLRAAEVLWPFIDADKVINVPVAKQHGLSGATLSMKNWYGVLGGHRVRLHQDIHRSIVDLAAMVKPTLTVLDGTLVMMSNGPSGGSLDDVARRDTVAACIDQVAIDAFGATLLGQDGASLGFVKEAAKRGLGRADFRSLKLEEVT